MTPRTRNALETAAIYGVLLPLALLMAAGLWLIGDGRDTRSERETIRRRLGL